MAALIGVSISSHAQRAQACEALPCNSDSLLPAPGKIPANADGVLLFSDASGPMQVTVEIDGKPTAVTERFESLKGGRGRVVLAPKGGFREGAKVKVDNVNRCNADGPPRIQVSFEVGPKADPPKDLGKLSAQQAQRGVLKVGTASGSCSTEEQAAWIDVELDLSPSAKPWSSLLEYSTLVDGKPWQKSDSINVGPPHGQSWLGRAKDRIYVLCPREFGFPGVTEGEHEVVMQARLGGGNVLSTPALRIDLRCGASAASPHAPAAGGAEPVPTSGASPTATSSAGTDTATPSSATSKPTRCGCRVAGERGTSEWTWAALGALALALGRRRRS